jgi:hypothetical protein
LDASFEVAVAMVAVASWIAMVVGAVEIVAAQEEGAGRNQKVRGAAAVPVDSDAVPVVVVPAAAVAATGTGETAATNRVDAVTVCFETVLVEGGIVGVGEVAAAEAVVALTMVEGAVVLTMVLAHWTALGITM